MRSAPTRGQLAYGLRKFIPDFYVMTGRIVATGNPGEC